MKIKDNMNIWYNLDENVWYKKISSGYEFIQIVWLDTCPYDSSKEWCVCRAKVEIIFDLFDAYDYFQENCLYDSWCVKGECNYQEALEYVNKQIAS